MRFPLLEDGRDGADDLDDMCDSANKNANHDSIVSANFNICPPAAQNGDNVGKELEKKNKTRRGIQAHS